MSVDKHARIPQSTSNRALTSLRKSALDLLSFAIKRQDWSANCCMIYAPGQGARCSWIQILSKNNKIIAKSDMDSFGTSFLRTTPPQQVPLNKSTATSPPQQGLHNNSSDRPQAASGLQFQRRLHIRPALAARSAPADTLDLPAAAGKATGTGLRGPTDTPRPRL